MQEKGVTLDMINNVENIMKKNKEMEEKLSDPKNNLTKEDLDKIKNHDNLKKEIKELKEQIEKK